MLTQIKKRSYAAFVCPHVPGAILDIHPNHHKLCPLEGEWEKCVK